jgi:hypothetical protein
MTNELKQILLEIVADIEQVREGLVRLSSRSTSGSHAVAETISATNLESYKQLRTRIDALTVTEKL